MIYDVLVSLLALEGIDDVLFLLGHVVIALFAVARRQPVLVLGGEQVEFFEQFHVLEHEMRGAFLEEGDGEVFGE